MEENDSNNTHQREDDNSVDAGYSANDKYLESEAGGITFTNDKSTFSNSDHFDHTNGGVNGQLEAGGDNGSLYSDAIGSGTEMPDADLIDDSINFDASLPQSITPEEISSDDFAPDNLNDI